MVLSQQSLDGYFDPGLVEAVEQGFIVPAMEVSEQFMALIAEWHRAFSTAKLSWRPIQTVSGSVKTGSTYSVTALKKARLRSWWTSSTHWVKLVERAGTRYRRCTPDVSDESVLGSKWDWLRPYLFRPRLDGLYFLVPADPAKVLKYCDSGCGTAIVRVLVSHVDDRELDDVFMFVRLSG